MPLSPRNTCSRGHNLLEVLVATGIFIMVAVAMAGVWTMYGSALSKSSEVLAANQLARGVAEGIMANGFDWMMEPANRTGPPADNADYFMERRIRTRSSTVHYNVAYQIFQHDPADNPLFTSDVGYLRVTVRWRSDTGSKEMEDDSDFNNSVVYSMAVFRGALR